MECGLSLGSNLGDRLAHLKTARDRLAAVPGVRLLAQAPVYETEPVGVRPEYAHLPYLNTVLIVASDLSPRDLHAACARIEEEAGRVRGEDRFAPRTLDIDVLYAGGGPSADPALVLPHPRWAQRRFVLQPLADVRPGLVLPGAAATVRAVLDALPAGEPVRLFAREW